MQYFETEESKRKMTDRRAKLGAKKRMRQRTLKKVIYLFLAASVVVVFYFTLGRTVVANWGKRQAGYVSQESVGAAKGTAGLFGRGEVKSAEKDYGKDINPATPPEAPPAPPSGQ